MQSTEGKSQNCISAKTSDPYTRLMEYDESLATVLTWRPVGSVEADSLGWRFITTEGRTVAVRPVQLPSNARPFCVPEKIESALRATRDLILLAHGRCGVNGEPEEPDYPAIDAAAREKVDHTATNEWYGKRADLQKQAKTIDPAPWKDAFNRTLAEQAAHFWPDVFAKADAAKKKALAEKYIASIPPEQYESRLRIHVRDDIFAQRAKQHAGLLKRVHEETEKENQAAEQARSAARAGYQKERERFFREIALYEINAFIGRTAGKKPVPVPEPRKGGGHTAAKRAEIVKKLTDPKDKGAAILEAIRSFILHELFKDPGTDLRRLVRFMGEQIGRKDMTLRVLLAYNRTMPEMFKGWVAETAKARKMKPTDAEKFLVERVTFIAECEGRRFSQCYPIEDMTAGADVMDCEDLENFTKSRGKLNHRAAPQTPPTTDSDSKTITSKLTLPEDPYMTMQEVCRFFHTTEEGIEGRIERGELHPVCRGPVKGGRRQLKRLFFRQEVWELHHQERRRAGLV